MPLSVENFPTASKKADLVSVWIFLRTISNVSLNGPNVVEADLLVVVVDDHDLPPIHLHAVASDRKDDEEGLVRGGSESYFKVFAN